MARFPGGRMANFRFVMIPGNEPCGDGNYVGITTVTIPQWLALLQAIGREDLCADDELVTFLGRFMRADEVHEALHAFTMTHTAEEVVEVCTAARVPAAVVGNGALLPEFAQPKARGTFVTQPGESWIRPRAPFRFSAVADRELRTADARRPTAPTFVRLRRVRDADDARTSAGTEPGERPFAGLRVVDFTAFWSGPFSTAWLCSMGADVIKVESVQRPDGLRFSATIRPKDEPRFYEMSALWHADQPRQAWDHARPRSSRRARAREAADRDGRRRHRELHAVGDGGVRAVVRRGASDQPRRRHAAAARVRPRGSVARPRWLRADDGADHRDGVAAPDTTTVRRSSPAAWSTRWSGRTPRSRSWPRSSTGRAPARVSSSRCR